MTDADAAYQQGYSQGFQHGQQEIQRLRELLGKCYHFIYNYQEVLFKADSLLSRLDEFKEKP